MSADSIFQNTTEGLSHVLKSFHRMEKDKDGYGLEFRIPLDTEMPCGTIMICFVSSHFVDDRDEDDREIMLELYHEHGKRRLPVSCSYTKNADLIHLHIFSADYFLTRVTRSGDAIIIRPSLSMNDVPMKLGEGWGHVVPQLLFLQWRIPSLHCRNQLFLSNYTFFMRRLSSRRSGFHGLNPGLRCSAQIPPFLHLLNENLATYPVSSNFGGPRSSVPIHLTYLTIVHMRVDCS